MNKADTVIYLDAKGQEHEALVTAVNPFNSGYVSLVYVDEAKPEADNVVKMSDVRHMDEIAETNPDLPTYHLNCWKEGYRLSRGLPSDHPANDHPHARTSDPDGKPIEVSRPEYEAQVDAHQARQAALAPAEDGYAASSEGEPEARPTDPPARPVEPPTQGDGLGQSNDQAKDEDFPNGIGFRFRPGHPTEEDLASLATEGHGTLEELRERFKAPEGFATLGDYQESLIAKSEAAATDAPAAAE